MYNLFLQLELTHSSFVVESVACCVILLTADVVSRPTPIDTVVSLVGLLLSVRIGLTFVVFAFKSELLFSEIIKIVRH